MADDHALIDERSPVRRHAPARRLAPRHPDNWVGGEVALVGVARALMHQRPRRAVAAPERLRPAGDGRLGERGDGLQQRRGRRRVGVAVVQVGDWVALRVVPVGHE